MRSIQFISFLLSLFLLSSCNSDDADDTTADSDVPIRVDINDNRLNIFEDSKLTFAILNTENSGTNGIGTFSLSTGGNIDNIVYGLSAGITGQNFWKLDLGDGLAFRTSGTLGEGGFIVVGSLVKDDGVTAVDEASTSEDVVITLTKLDLDKKVVSGTFSFSAVGATSMETYEVSNGQFTDIPLIIQ